MGNHAWLKHFSGRRRGASRRWSRSGPGFTLLEVVMVLLVLGILAFVAINRMTNISNAVAEADALRSALRYAQSRAMADVYTWGVTFSSGGYTLVEANPNVAGVLPGQGGASRNMPSGVSLHWALASGNTIYFDWRGQPVSSSIAVIGGTANVVGTNQTVTFTQSGQNMVVTVTPYTGFVP